jgi:hypothetical protein
MLPSNAKRTKFENMFQRYAQKMNAKSLKRKVPVTPRNRECTGTSDVTAFRGGAQEKV